MRSFKKSPLFKSQSVLKIPRVPPQFELEEPSKSQENSPGGLDTRQIHHLRNIDKFVPESDLINATDVYERQLNT